MVNINDVLGAIDGHDQRQAYGHFGGGDGHYKDHEGLSVDQLVIVGEGDENQVCGVEHQFQAHEDHNGILAQQKADDADDEEDASQ